MSLRWNDFPQGKILCRDPEETSWQKPSTEVAANSSLIWGRQVTAHTDQPWKGLWFELWAECLVPTRVMTAKPMAPAPRPPAHLTVHTDCRQMVFGPTLLHSMTAGQCRPFHGSLSALSQGSWWKAGPRCAARGTARFLSGCRKSVAIPPAKFDTCLQQYG